MEKKIPDNAKEVVFASSDPKEIRQMGRMLAQGIIRKIAPKIYTPIWNEAPEKIIERNILEILANQYPGAVLSHRSAFEFKPTSAGHIFITYTYTKKIKLPGVTIRILAGRSAMKGDNRFRGELFVSQRERAFLENMQISKKPGPESKTLSLPEIEEKLDMIINTHGEKGLNDLRDKAREIADQLGLKQEFDKLNRLISSMLTTQPVNHLKSPLAIARALGTPYDKARVSLFEGVFKELINREFKSKPDRNTTVKAFKNFAFFESYFSNYIEGTIFEIEEAKEIIKTGIPISSRKEDSHDILGTYQIVSNKKEMSRIPRNPDELIEILAKRHAVLLQSRQDKKPGEFKDKNNRAGDTHFVDLKLVRGTLVQGFEIYNSLRNPFARACFMMFMISEIHPFLDGNGRIARVMMNTELVNKNESRIIIPTVYREDYMGTLKLLTNTGNCDPYIRMLQKAHEFSATIYSDNMDEMQAKLEYSNAFHDPKKGKLRIEPITSIHKLEEPSSSYSVKMQVGDIKRLSLSAETNFTSLLIAVEGGQMYVAQAANWAVKYRMENAQGAVYMAPVNQQTEITILPGFTFMKFITEDFSEENSILLERIY